jgi:hypothetical protein
LSAVVEMHAGDDEEACCSIITHIAGRGEAASNEGILAAANAQQHTGMRHLAAPLQENGAGWRLAQNRTRTLLGKALRLLDYPAG